MKQETAELVGYCPEISEQVFRPILAAEKEVKDFAKRTGLLRDDISFCSENFNKGGKNDFWRRTVVRSVFVFLEAACYGLKRIALHQFDLYQVDFSPAELALLKEEKYSLDDKGEAHAHDKNFQRFIPNLKFAIRCFAKSHDIPFDFDTSKIPLKEFEELRNRITHPKQLSDLTISDTEIKTTETVGQWFVNAVSDLIKKSTGKSPPVRMPQVVTRLNVTKDFFVMQPDGNVYQFDSVEEAEKYRDSKIVKDLTFMTPLVFRSEHLRQQ